MAIAGQAGGMGGPPVKGSGIVITDGTNTVSGALQLSVTGGTVGGTTPNATLTISGGGGGQLPVYAATTGTTITITSGQGAANSDGGQFQLYGGAGQGTGRGGPIYLQAGTGGATPGSSGGAAIFRSGYANPVGGYGGNCTVNAGGGYGVGYKGGNLFLKAGTGNNGATDGNVFLYLPTTDPSSPNAVFSNHNILMHSGVSNYSGALAGASIATKTLTFVNGILVSVA